MKRILYILFIISATLRLAAQPVITTSILPSIGDTILVGVDTLLVSPGAAGANIAWDFRALPLHILSSRIYLDPAKTTFFNFAPAATMARTDAAQTVFSFWKNTANTSTYYGFVELNKYDQNFNSLPIAYYKFPISLGNNFNDSFSAYTNPGGIRGPGKYYFSADAWGALFLPHKTVLNTLRTKSILYVGDSSVNNYSLTVEYAWYLEGKKDPLLVISSVVINKALYKKFAIYDYASGLGITAINEKPILKIYPNPAQQTLFLERNEISGNENINIKIYDRAGSLLESQLMSNKTDIQKIDLAQLPSGFYFVELSDQNKWFHYKFIKE